MKDITMYCMNARTCNDSDNIVHTHYVTHDQVQCAINKIKPGKSDCIDGMLLGYEPADLTVHPPPELPWVGSCFSYRCLVFPKKCPQRKTCAFRSYSG